MKKSLLIAIALLAVVSAGWFVLRGTADTPPAVTNSADLTDPAKKDTAMQLVSSAENSSLDWKAQYEYIEWNVEGSDDENRGYTGGLIGFCSGCGDMAALVERYTELKPDNGLRTYQAALNAQTDRGIGKVSQDGLGQPFEAAWQAAAKDPLFRQAQDQERDRVYFDPAVKQGKADGLHALGQFAYYDALVVHGPGDDATSFGGIRKAALQTAKSPAQGGDETAYLTAFLDARNKVMRSEQAHEDTSRIDDAQRVFLKQGNLDLNRPLHWQTYGDDYDIGA